MNVSTSALPCALALAALLVVAAPLDAQSAPQADSAFDGVIAKSMADAGIMGVAAAVIVDRKVAWTKGYGFADYERTRPFTPQTVMPVASVSKTFTGVAMMRAVQEGLLSLDADINTYLPFRVVNPHQPNAPITLRHLATHTSGITDRWDVYRRTYRYGDEPTEPLGDFLADYFTLEGASYSPDNFLDARPGDSRDYSNIGASLAGFIVERAVGELLPDYTRKHIFAPLGMTSTVWKLSTTESASHVANAPAPAPSAAIPNPNRNRLSISAIVREVAARGGGRSLAGVYCNPPRTEVTRCVLKPSQCMRPA